MATDETFKKSRWGWVASSWGWTTSSEGYAVRVGSRTGIDYRDRDELIHIDSESMSVGLEVVVYAQSIPDTLERPRAIVLDNLRGVFEFRGWTLTVVEA